MKARSAAMFLIGGLSIGAAATAYVMTNNQTKAKAHKLVNTAMDTAHQKLTKMN